MQKQTRGSRTRALILQTGLKMWENNPDSVNAHAIAKKIEMTHGSVMYHFPEGVKTLA